MALTLTGDGAVGPLSATEIGYLDGVTSAVQAQLNGKAVVQSGSWSPVVADAGAGGVVAAVGTVSAEYLKIGSLVWINCQLNNINNAGTTSTNAVFVRGLPFAPASLAIGSCTTTRITWAANSAYIPYLEAAGYVTFWSVANANANESPMTMGNIVSTGADIWFTACYRTAA